MKIAPTILLLILCPVLSCFGAYKGAYSTANRYRVQYSPTKIAQKQIDLLEKSVKSVGYKSNPTIFVGSITKEKIEKSAKTTGYTANCVDYAVRIGQKAHELGLNYNYKVELNHIVVIVEYKDGSKWRYSNDKRTWRVN